MSSRTTLLIGLAVLVVLLAGCNEPLWLPENRLPPEYRAIPRPIPIYGYLGPDVTYGPCRLEAECPEPPRY